MGPRLPAGPIVDEKRLLRCVHCGFCLTACPTFSLRSDEADSPRGRIYFIRALAEHRAAPTAEMRLHLERCLSCLSCETACPSGVEYRHLIEDARSWLFGRSTAPFGWRTFFRHVIPSVRLLRLVAFPLKVGEWLGARGILTWLAGMNPVPWARRAVDLLPDRIPAPWHPPLPEVSPARGERRLKVGYATGCIMEGMMPDLNRLAVEILRELGCEVVVPRGQGCCGALAAHEGDRALSERLAGRLIRSFSGMDVDVIVASAAGCGSSMRGYGETMPGVAGAKEFAAKVRDFTEVAADLIVERPPRREIRMKVAYQEACHLGHAQRITVPPRSLLKAIPGIEPVELPEQEMCCGSAGVYNLLQPELSDELKSRKAGHVMASGAAAVVTANPGCYLQLKSALRGREGAPRVYHLAELLGEAYGLDAGRAPASAG